MVRVMDGPYTGPFNIGNPTEFTMLELAQVVKEVVNPKATIVYKENTADDPSRRKPDISKARAPGPLHPSPCGAAMCMYGVASPVVFCTPCDLATPCGLHSAEADRPL